ncbi:hypothetical protein [Cryobacterium sp. AP23]
MAGLTVALEESVEDESVADESVVDSEVAESELDESVADSVLDVPVLEDSVLDVPALEDSVPDVPVLDVPVLDVVPVDSLSASVVPVDVSALDRLVASESAHSCRPSADAATTAARPIVLVMIVASLLPRSCRFISVPPFWCEPAPGVRTSFLDDSRLRGEAMRFL